MSTEIIWVPKPDGKTWTSSRTRDLVDLAFTIERQDNDRVMITIRCSKNSDENGRARMVIGRVYGHDVASVKEFVQSAVNEANKASTRDDARKDLLNIMMASTLDFTPAGYPLNPGILKDGVWCGKDQLGMSKWHHVATTEPEVDEDLSAGGWYVPPTEEDLLRMSVSMGDLVDEPSVEVPTSGIYKVEPETESWTPWNEVADDLAKAIAAKRASIAMKQSTEAVREAVEPVIEPVIKVEIPQFITINGKQIPITYPK